MDIILTRYSSGRSNPLLLKLHHHHRSLLHKIVHFFYGITRTRGIVREIIFLPDRVS